LPANYPEVLAIDLPIGKDAEGLLGRSLLANAGVFGSAWGCRLDGLASQYLSLRNQKPFILAQYRNHIDLMQVKYYTLIRR
jgi:hypothetical protein